MKKTVLFVDDEINILNSIERIFLKEKEIILLRASDGNTALAIIKKENVSVIVSDQQMPGMKGVDLLTKVKEVSPETIRIILTGYADLPVIINSINKGEIFKFIVKPCDNDLLIKTVKEAIQRYRVKENILMEKDRTMLSLAQTIELKDPFTRGHCNRVAQYALLIADHLALDPVIKREIKYGSWLHDCGKIGIPENILNHNGVLSGADMDVVKKHPQWGAEIAQNANLSGVTVKIILNHHERYDGKGYPSNLKGKDIPPEARIVAVADIFDALKTDRPFRKGYDFEKSLSTLSSMKGSFLDPELVEIFMSLITQKLGKDELEISREKIEI